MPMRNRVDFLYFLRFTTIALLFFFVISLEGEASQAEPPYLIQTWNKEKGLTYDTASSIVQTPDGYLWFAVENGLIRFDGVKFSNIPFFQSDKSKPLITKSPEVLFFDQLSGILWIGTNDTLTSYNYKSGVFETFTKKQGLPDKPVRTIVSDRNGNIWISFRGNGDLVRLSNRVFTVFNETQGLTFKKINTILEDSKGNLLLGAMDRGVYIYKNGRFSSYLGKYFKNVDVISMFEDVKGNLWIASENGLLRVNEANELTFMTTTNGLTGNKIRALMEDHEKNIWIGTDKGIDRITLSGHFDRPLIQSVYSPRTGVISLQTFPDGSFKRLAIDTFNPSVITFFEDREENLWVGTLKDGILQIKDSKFILYSLPETLREEIVLSFFQAPDSSTMIGTMSGHLIHVFPDGAVEIVESSTFKEAGITSIASDSKGSVWLGTIGKGVFHNVNGKYFRYTTEEGLADNTLTSIYVDSTDTVWCCTQDGLSAGLPQPSAKTLFHSFPYFKGKIVNNVIVDQNSRVWVATQKGLYIFKYPILSDKDPVKRFAEGISFLAAGGILLKDINVTSVYEDSLNKGIYWVTTDGGGLNRVEFKNQKPHIFSYPLSSGMVTQKLYQFVEDGNRNFWFMSDVGVLRINKESLNRFAFGKVDRIDCIVYDETDGLAHNEFNNQVSPNALIKMNSGEIWFNTKNGISIVNPSNVKVNKIPPNVIIEKIVADGKIVTIDSSKNTYSFDKIGEIGIYFTAPMFSSPRKVRFQYKMEGIDSNWKDHLPGNPRVVFYKNLKPGSYVFFVKACNEDGVWSTEEKSIRIIYTTVFYKSFLFIFFVCLFGAGVIGFIAWKVIMMHKRIIEKDKIDDSSKNELQDEGVTASKRPPLSDGLARSLQEKLVNLMEKEKVFKDEDLSLDSLALKLGVSRHILSQYLNENLGKNFADYVNSYRVEEAKWLMDSPKGKDMKNDYIADEVGFNNKGVFYTAFKKFAGMTPNAYRKRKSESY